MTKAFLVWPRRFSDRAIAQVGAMPDQIQIIRPDVPTALQIMGVSRGSVILDPYFVSTQIQGEAGSRIRALGHAGMTVIVGIENCSRWLFTDQKSRKENKTK